MSRSSGRDARRSLTIGAAADRFVGSEGIGAVRSRARKQAVMAQTITSPCLGAPSARRPDDMFFPHGGFMHLVPQGEIEAAAGGSGYRILYFGHLTCFTRMRC